MKDSATVAAALLALAVASRNAAEALTQPEVAPAPPNGRQATGYVDGRAVQIQLVSIGNGFELRDDVALAFGSMRDAARWDSVTLVVNSAFRTFEQQAALRALYESGKGALAAKPGYSNHEGGTAADIESDSGRNAAFQWLTANASAYGFKRTVASEPWHWEFV